MSVKIFDPFVIFKFTFDDRGWFQSCAVPKGIETCPCCSSRLWADASGWCESDEGIMMPDEIKYECDRDMRNDMQCFKEYEHSEIWRMPYVYWLPVETHCTAWVDRMLRIYYKLDAIPKKWLEKNGQIRLFEKRQIAADIE